jgi:hypothetical protein
MLHGLCLEFGDILDHGGLSAAFTKWHLTSSQCMPQVIDTAFGITGVICGLMGTLGYLMYGNGVKDVVTFNLPPVRPRSP